MYLYSPISLPLPPPPNLLLTAGEVLHQLGGSCGWEDYGTGCREGQNWGTCVPYAHTSICLGVKLHCLSLCLSVCLIWKVVVIPAQCLNLYQVMSKEHMPFPVCRYVTQEYCGPAEARKAGVCRVVWLCHHLLQVQRNYLFLYMCVAMQDSILILRPL